MSENLISTLPIFVLSGVYHKAAMALYDVLEQRYGSRVVFNPELSVIQTKEGGIAVCFGQSDDALEAALQAVPLIRVCDRREEKQSGTVILFAPIRMAEIIAEVDTLLDISLRSQTIILPLGDYALNKKTRILSGRYFNETTLTEKEAGVILYLYERMSKDGQPIGREDLLKEVWKYADGIDTHTIETHIYRLRQKIEKNKTGLKAKDLVLTVDGGYWLDI